MRESIMRRVSARNSPTCQFFDSPFANTERRAGAFKHRDTIVFLIAGVTESHAINPHNPT
jgi:hypothetical protein